MTEIAEPDVKLTFFFKEDKLPDVISLRRVETLMVRNGENDQPCLVVCSKKSGTEPPTDEDMHRYLSAQGYERQEHTGLFVRKFNLAS